MSSGKIVRALILGAPASGKGTISSRIVERYGFTHISSGDNLRRNIEEKTPLGLTVKKYLDGGKLVPDEVITQFMLEEIKKVPGSWLLDGFPRTVSQAEHLWKLQPVEFALNLNVPFEVIIHRVKGRWVHLPSGRVYNTEFNAPKVPGKDDVTGEDLSQRPDDKPEAVARRLNLYNGYIQPVMDFYRAKGIFKDFDGKTSDEIWPKVIQFLDPKLKR